MKKNYRKLWTNVYGEIPKDEFGRSFEIHHIDGNHTNDAIDNLMCISIKEHYDIHYAQGDYGACVLIAKRMNLSPSHMSDIQRGKKRPGIGGVKKGTTPWNKGIKGYKLTLSEDGKLKKAQSSKKNNIITDHMATKIRLDFEQKVKIQDDRIGKIQRNGKPFSYERAFCIVYSGLYKVSSQYIYRILKNKIKNV